MDGTHRTGVVEAVSSRKEKYETARGGAGERTTRERRARSAAEELTREGTRISFDRSIHVPEDEICFFIFDAASGRTAALAAERAELDPIRVVEAVSSEKEEQ